MQEQCLIEKYTENIFLMLIININFRIISGVHYCLYSCCQSNKCHYICIKTYFLIEEQGHIWTYTLQVTKPI